MDPHTVLERLGFSSIEARIYLLLVSEGGTAGTIAKKIEAHRATIYSTLQRLIEKGYVSYITKDGKRYFEATDPAILLSHLKEREEQLREVLPSLSALYAARREQAQAVQVFTGVNGIKTVWKNIFRALKGGGTYVDFGVSGMFREKLGPFWYQWQRMKKKSKIKSYCIFNKSVIESNPTFFKNYVGAARIYPSEFWSITDTVVYQDTVVLFIWTAQPPLAVVIKDKDNATSYWNHFWFLWKHAKKLSDFKKNKDE